MAEPRGKGFGQQESIHGYVIPSLVSCPRRSSGFGQA
jgi:hypothetical protein